jgi:hypothetical protein
MSQEVEKDLKNFSNFKNNSFQENLIFVVFSYLDIAEGKRVPHKGQTSPKVSVIYQCTMSDEIFLVCSFHLFDVLMSKDEH